MNNRIGTILATGLLTLMSGGCCNFSDLWFGRGAACGLCTKLPKPQFGNCLQAPLFQPKCGSQPFASPAPFQPAPHQPAPYQPAPCRAPQWQAPSWQAPQCQAPQCQAPTCTVTPECGCNAYAEAPCGDQCYGSAYGADCGCGSVADGEVVHDPYLGGQVTDQGVIGEHVVPGSVVPGTSIPGSTMPGSAVPGPPIQSDQFVPRGSGSYQSQKFDADGNKIIWEEPLPTGTNAL